MARIHGKNGQFNRYDLTGSPTTVTPVGDIKSWTLNMTKDKVDVTAFGDTNKQKVLGLPDFSGTFSGFWNSVTSPDLFDIILGSAAIGLKLVPNTAEPTFYFSGLAYLDGSISVDAAAAVTVDGTFDAAGNWTIAP
jgi:predicted patatin/cPLA2 family phospholipase